MTAGGNAATLTPSASYVLPAQCGQLLGAVAWASDDSVVVGGFDGLSLFRFKQERCDRLAGNGPDGISAVMNVVIDGAVFYAFGFPGQQYAGSLLDGSMLFRRQTSGFFVISDVALKGSTRYMLGYYANDTRQGLPFPVAWKSDAPWKGGDAKLVPVHAVRTAEAADAIRGSAPPFTGAMAVDRDGTLYVITAAEPGLFRYRADGTALPVLGGELRELTIPRLADLVRLYGADEESRYRELVNKQPIVDDLIITPDGPALIVRRFNTDHVEWELWYPDEKGVRWRVPIAVRRPGSYGHLRCDVGESRMACILDKAQPSKPGGPSSVMVFTLPRLPAAASSR